MKTDIEIVTGFLGYGKTTFINSLLKESQTEGEKLLIIQMENGRKKLCPNSDMLNFPSKIIHVKSMQALCDEIKNSMKGYKPHRILIEFNGTEEIENLSRYFTKADIYKYAKISTVYFVGDSRKILNNITTLGAFLIPCIQKSNLIVLNDTDKISRDELKKEIRAIRTLNPKSYILEVDNHFNLRNRLKESRVINNGALKKLKIKLMK